MNRTAPPPDRGRFRESTSKYYFESRSREGYMIEGKVLYQIRPPPDSNMEGRHAQIKRGGRGDS